LDVSERATVAGKLDRHPSDCAAYEARQRLKGQLTPVDCVAYPDCFLEHVTNFRSQPADIIARPALSSNLWIPSAHTHSYRELTGDGFMRPVARSRKNGASLLLKPS
jgi:hypothetical protein